MGLKNRPYTARAMLCCWQERSFFVGQRESSYCNLGSIGLE